MLQLHDTIQLPRLPLDGARRGVRRAMTAPVLDLDGRMVDRQQELTELRDAVEAAARVGGECVLLSGVPGVGKSTLMQAFGVDVSRRNCVFAYGRCRDGAPAPYSALGDALSSLVRTMEATGPAERDSWRADLVSGMRRRLPASSRNSCPNWRECWARPSHDAEDSMQRMLAVACTAPSSG